METVLPPPLFFFYRKNSNIFACSLPFFFGFASHSVVHTGVATTKIKLGTKRLSLPLYTHIYIYIIESFDGINEAN